MLNNSNVRQIKLHRVISRLTRGKLKFVAYTLIIAALILPKIITFTNQANDAFVYSSFAVAEKSLQQDRIVIQPFELPPALLGRVSGDSPFSWQSHANGISYQVVVTSLIVIFSRVTGITLDEMLFLPLGGLIIVFLAFALGKVLSKSNAVALLYAFFVSYELNNTNSIFYISLGFALHFTFLIILIKSMEARTISRSAIALLSIVFVASSLAYYSSEAFNLIVIASTSLVVALASKRWLKLELKEKIRRFGLLALAFGIWFLTFQGMVSTFLERASFSRLLSTVLGYFQYVLNVFSRNVSQIQQFRSETTNLSSIYVDTVTKLLIVLPSVTFILYYTLSSLRKSKTVRISVTFAVILSLLVAGIGELIIYWSYGPAGGFRYFYWFISLVALYSLSCVGRGKNKKRLFFFMSVLLVFTGILRFTMSWQSSVNSSDGRNLYNIMTPTAKWVVAKTDECRIVSDLFISARLFYEATSQFKGDTIYPYEFFNDLQIMYEFNETDVNFTFEQRNYSYIVLSSSFSQRNIIGDVWSVQGPPLKNNISFFDSYTLFDRIYDDRQGIVYRFES